MMVVQIKEVVMQVGESRQMQDTSGECGKCGRLLFLEGQRKTGSVQDVFVAWCTPDPLTL